MPPGRKGGSIAFLVSSASDGGEGKLDEIDREDYHEIGDVERAHVAHQSAVGMGQHKWCVMEHHRNDGLRNEAKYDREGRDEEDTKEVAGHEAADQRDHNARNGIADVIESVTEDFPKASLER